MFRHGRHSNDRVYTDPEFKWTGNKKKGYDTLKTSKSI